MKYQTTSLYCFVSVKGTIYGVTINNGNDDLFFFFFWITNIYCNICSKSLKDSSRELTCKDTVYMYHVFARKLTGYSVFH